MNKAFFNFIKGKIQTAIPAIKTVQIYRSQMDHVREKKDEVIKAYPALFIEFIVNETRNLSLGIKNVDLTLRCRFALNHFTFERPQDLDFLDTFDGTMQMMRGGESDPVQFSSLQEVATQHDPNFDDVNEPYVDYITCWRKLSGYSRHGDITGPLNAFTVTTTIDDDRELFTDDFTEEITSDDGTQTITP